MDNPLAFLCFLLAGAALFTVPAVAAPTGTLTPVHTFSPVDGFGHNAEGAQPFTALTQGADGNLYGAAASAGPNGYGTVYRVSLDATLSVIAVGVANEYVVNYYASLIQGTDGKLYGVTSKTAFSLSLDGTFTTLHTFTVPEGSDIQAALVQGKDGNFYGTANGGGPSNYGTVFQLTPAGAVTVLHGFSGGADGKNPQADVIQGQDGNFYGTTNGGGASNGGTVFRISADGTFATLVNFGGMLGQFPHDGLTQTADGNIYGRTSQNGAFFRMTPAGAVTYLHDDAVGDSFSRYGRLVEGPDGNLYGNIDRGVIQLTPDGTETLLHDFLTDPGVLGITGSRGAPVLARDGNFYGTFSFEAGGGVQGSYVYQLAVGDGAQLLSGVNAHTFPTGAVIPVSATFSPPATGDEIVEVEFLANGVRFAALDAAGNPLGPQGRTASRQEAPAGGTTGVVYNAICQLPGSAQLVSIVARALTRLGTTQTAVAKVNVVVAIDKAPMVSLGGLANGARVPVGGVVSAPAIATDPDGAGTSAHRGARPRDYNVPSGLIALVEFYLNGLKMKAATQAPYTFDFTPDKPGTYVISAIATDGAGLSAASAPLRVEAGEAPAVSIRLKGSSSIAAGANGKFAVSLDGGAVSPGLTVLYKAKGTAQKGVDYQDASGTLMIPAGETNAKVKVKSLLNPAADGARTLTIKLLASPTGAYTLGAPKKATLSIAGSR